MKIQNKEINLFFNLLKDIKGITFPEARKRDAIVKQLISFSKTFEENRLKIVTEFCEKDEEGNLKVEKDNFTVLKGKEEEFKKELDTLSDEEVELTLDTQSVRKMLDNTEYTPKVGEMELIDALIAKL